MEGLYLYCIKKGVTSLPFSTKGLDEKGEVFLLPFQQLEAIVSKVSLEEFDSEAIQIKAQEDLRWIKEKAILHSRVIEEAMRDGEEIVSLIPMKFGTIFKEEKSLEETLNKHYEQFKATLERLEGKQEWSVKAYLKDRKAFEEKIKEKSEIIKEKEKEIASLPEGMAYFMEGELEEVISKKMDRELKNIVASLFETLKEKAVDSVRCKILERDLTGRREPMVLNAGYLISDGKVEDFKKETEELSQRMETMGFSIEYSGPWPAYNFANY